jgi:hypothetical protein
LNATRSSGYLSREPSLSRESNALNNNHLPGHGYHPSRDTSSSASTPRTRRGVPFLARESSAVSLNGNTAAASSCDCPGCPGNPRCGVLPRSYNDADDSAVAAGGQLEDPEDYLDTLDRKVTEIMNRDSSRRSSYNDLAASKRTEDMYGPLSLSYGRKKTLAGLGGTDLNCNPKGYGGGRVVPEGVIRFEEDDGKASSSEEAMDSSQEDLSQIWSDEDSDHYVLRRRR